MIIVAGHLIVAAERRDSYLADCAGVVEQARLAPGCLEFSISADLVDSGRVAVFERWESREAVESFRGDGPDDGQRAEILSANVAEYEVAEMRSLT